MPTRHVRTFLLLVALTVSWCLLVGASSGQPPKEQPAPDKPEKRIFALKHVRAQEAARLLRELLGKPDPRSRLAVGVDDRSNSLVVSGKADQLNEIAVLLEKLDQPGPAKEAGRAELQIVHLRFLTPDQNTAEALRLVLDGRNGRFTLDRDRKLVIVYADRETLRMAEALLQELDQATALQAEPGQGEVQVRLVWLAGGPVGEKAPAPPDDLREVTADLRMLGIDKPALAAQTLIRTQLNGRFELSGQAQLGEMAGLLTATGQVIGTRSASRLEITINATQGGRSPVTLCSLQTQVAVTPGQAVILGVAPVGQLTTAFVAQVLPVKPADKPAKPAAPPKEEKTYFFEMRAKPWNQVFEWLSDQTGLPVITDAKLTGGGFTFIAPKGKQYTLPEIIDILNEALIQQKHMLIRHERRIVLLPADQITPELIPRVQIDELDQRGNTELVSVVLPLKAIVADEIAPEIKKLLGPFGEVVVVSQGNRLVLRDTAGTLKRIHKLIQEIEADKPAKPAPPPEKGASWPAHLNRIHQLIQQMQDDKPMEYLISI